MHFYGNVFAELAARIRCGDFEAQEQFRDEMESALVLMARQTLRTGKGTSSIARRILVVAQRLRSEEAGDIFVNAEDFVHRVAHTVCAEVVARLQSKGVRAAESIGHDHGATLLAS